MNRCNSRWILWLLGILVWAMSVSQSIATEVLPTIEKIVIYKEAIFACSHQKKKDAFSTKGEIEVIFLHSWSFAQPKVTKAVEVGRTDNLRLRWSIAYHHCWIAEAFKTDFPASPQPLHFSCQRLDFDPRKGVVFESTYADLNRQPCTAVAEHLGDLAWIGLYASRFPEQQLYYDYLPISEKALQTFVLTNLRGRIERIPAKPDEGKHRIAHVTAEEAKTPKWSLTIYTTAAVWDKNKGKWMWEYWKPGESLPVLFQEPFQAVGQAETYYFITASGKVYISKKPEKGKERTMEAFWTDKEQRVIAFVTDADQERTFVFTKNQKQGEKNVYFELTDKPKPLPYNLADVKPPKEVSEPLKTALPYANILLAAGKIKVPKPKE